MMHTTLLRNLLLSSLLLSVAACGGGGGGGGNNPPPTFTIGGTVSGLSGTGLRLSSNGVTLDISGNGPFAFANALPSGTQFNVAVAAQPGKPTQTCSVVNGSGTLAGNFTAVQVTCVNVPLTLASSTPADDAADVERGGDLVLSFSADIDLATVTKNSVLLQSAAGTQSTVVDVLGKNITVIPTGTLLPATEYTLSASANLKGVGGEALAGIVSTTFTTRDNTLQPAEPLEQLAGDAIEPQVAFAPNGDGLAVWTQKSGGVSQIFTSSYLAGVWQAPRRLDTTVAPDASQARLGIDKNGNAVATWKQNNNAAGGVWVSHYVRDTDSWQPALRLSIGNDPAPPALGVAANGSAIVVFNEIVAGPAGIVAAPPTFRVRAARYSPGQPWSALQMVEEGLPPVLPQSVAGIDASGRAIVIWHDGGAIRAKRSDTNDQFSEPAITLSSGVGAATDARLAVSANGNAVAAWRQLDQVFARYYDAIEAWDEQPTLLGASHDAEDSESAPSVAVDPQGNAIIAWTNVPATGAAELFVRHNFANDGWLSDAIRLPTSGLPFAPQVGLDPAGNALLAWMEFESNVPQVMANRYRAREGWLQQPIAVSTELAGFDEASRLAVALGDNGDGAAVWPQKSGTTFHLEVASFE